MDPEKSKAIDKCQLLINPKELQIFHSMCNYYTSFMLNYAHISTTLYNILCKNTKFDLKTDFDTAFKQLKHALVHTPILALPNFDNSFEVEMYASGAAVGTNLM